MPDKIEEYRKQHPEQKDLFHFVDDVKIEEKELPLDKNTSWKIQKITESINSLLQYKNINNPLESKNSLSDMTLILNKSKTIELLSNIVYLCVDKNWISFEEFKD